MPPPSHIDCNPYFLFCCFNAYTKLVISFVPDDPKIYLQKS